MKKNAAKKTLILSTLSASILCGCATSFNVAKTPFVAKQISAADEAYSQCMSNVLSSGSYSRINKRFILLSSYDYVSISKTISINATKDEIQMLMDWFSNTQSCTAIALEQYGRIDPDLALKISRNENDRLTSYKELLNNKNTLQFNNEQRNFFNNRMLIVKNWAANLDNRTAELNSNYEWSVTQEDYAFVNSAVGKIPRYQAEATINQIDQLQVAQGKFSVAQSDYANLNPSYRLVKIMNTACSYNQNNNFVCREIYF